MGLLSQTLPKNTRNTILELLFVAFFANFCTVATPSILPDEVFNPYHAWPIWHKCQILLTMQSNKKDPKNETLFRNVLLSALGDFAFVTNDGQLNKALIASLR